ncbi:hypothetical protein [Rubritalea tangerina]|uniref:hypothetical protein n=1 Tax=Rubritalea tangerina TaxID=430798 RepID=UPI0036152181
MRLLYPAPTHPAIIKYRYNPHHYSVPLPPTPPKYQFSAPKDLNSQDCMIDTHSHHRHLDRTLHQI